MKASDLHVPGLWKCPQCGFTQQNQILAPTGVFASAAPELRPCPNDGQPVTWKEHAKDLEKTLDTILDAQCNEVTSRVEHIRGGMGPDTVLVTLQSGLVLQIGQEGVNLYESRGSLEQCAEPMGGLVFP